MPAYGVGSPRSGVVGAGRRTGLVQTGEVTSTVHQQTVHAWLADLASEAPTPGGGAAAAMNAAVGAALVSMVCNLTIGKPRYAAHESTMIEVRHQADQLRQQALELAEQDAAAFGRVMAAYRLPRQTEQEQQTRNQAIQDALVEAADVPLRTAAVAAEVIGLADRILEGANVNVISDVAVAAASARAALSAAVINVEVNLAGITDADRKAKLTDALVKYQGVEADADRIIAAVRSRINQ